MAINTFLFDLDGTLIDSNTHVIHCFKHAWQEVLDDDISVDLITSTFGIPLAQAIEMLAPEHAEKLVKAYRRESDRRGDADITVVDGALETLQTLKKFGAYCGIVTSKKRVNAYRSLDHFNLSPYIDVFIGPEDTTIHKPDPTPVNLALSALSRKADEALMIGDSPHDIAAGKAAGTATCGVTFAASGPEPLIKAAPTILIDHLSHLIPFYGHTF